MRIGFAPNAVPPTLEIVTECARANYAQTVLLPDIVNFNDSAHRNARKKVQTLEGGNVTMFMIAGDQ
jgi:hypothetical protein